MISQRTSGDVAILLPSFREETVREDAGGLASLVQNLAAAGNRHLVVDLSDTEGCADDVAGVLIHAMALHDKLGGRVVLCGLSEDFRDYFHMARLDQVFEAYATEAEAIASFGRR